MKTWTKLILAVIIGLVGLGIRLDASSRLTIDADEDTYINNALHYADSIRNGNWKQIYKYDQNVQHPVLNKLAYSVALLGVDPAVGLKDKDMVRKIPASQTEGALWVLTARRMAAFLGGASVFLLAWINPIAGLFLAFHSAHIRFTSEIYLESLPALTSLAAMMAYIPWRKSEFSEKPGRLRWLWLAASAIFLGMTAAGKYIYCVVGLAILVDFITHLVKNKQKMGQRLITITVWGLLAVAMFFVFNPIIWIYTWERLSASILFHINYPSTDNVVGSGRDWWYPLYLLVRPTSVAYPWNKDVFLFEPDAWITLLGFLGVPVLWRQKRAYAIWFGVSLIFLLIWATKWDQYVMIILPSLCLSAGMLVEWVGRWGWSRFR